MDGIPEMNTPFMSREEWEQVLQHLPHKEKDFEMALLLVCVESPLAWMCYCVVVCAKVANAHGDLPPDARAGDSKRASCGQPICLGTILSRRAQLQFPASQHSVELFVIL